MPGGRLTVQERRTIERSYRIGLSQRQIAAVIGRSPATVCRELKRTFVGAGSSSPQRRHARAGGAGYLKRYDAEKAHRWAQMRGRRPKAWRMDHQPLRREVWRLLRADWSPEQIANSLPLLFPDDAKMRVSHETIYRCLFLQTRGALRRELTAHLRSQRMTREPRSLTEPRRRFGISEEIKISARPSEADDRAVPGHWEGDLILGATGKGAILTLVERSTRFVMLAPLPTRHTAPLARAALAELIAQLPLHLKRSIAWDQGSEMAEHAAIRVETGVPIYFCDPHSPWQRGTNENTNGLLRQYWPKGSDLTTVTAADCDAVALRLNTRPRETLDWQTPAQVLNKKLVATTG